MSPTTEEAPVPPSSPRRGPRRAHPEDFRLARPPHRWRRRLLFGASVLLVALVIVVESWRPWHEGGDPRASQRVQGSTPFELHGYRVELASVEDAHSYPGEGRRAKPVEAVPGATLVKVLFNQHRLPGSPPLAGIEGTCTITLADRSGRIWGNQVSNTVAGMPETDSCTEEEDDDDPPYPESGVRQFGVVVMVPESLRGELVIRVNDTDGYVEVDPG